MGGLFSSPSVLEVDSINQVINKSILKLSSTTTSGSSVSQYIEASDGATVSGNKQYIDVTTNTSSIINASQTSDFSSTIKSDVMQELEKKSVALLGSLDGLTQNNNVNLKDKIENGIENLNITDITAVCSLNDSITQNIVATRGATITNNSQEVKSDFLQSCSTKTENNMRTMSDMTNAINQRATVTAESPLNFISDMFNGAFKMIILIILVIITGFVVIIGPGQLDATGIIRDTISASTGKLIIPSAKPAAQSVAKPAAQSVAKPAAQSVAKPAAQSVAKPEAI